MIRKSPRRDIINTPGQIVNPPDNAKTLADPIKDVEKKVVEEPSFLNQAWLKGYNEGYKQGRIDEIKYRSVLY